MKLTEAQQAMIDRLTSAEEIHYGVSWYYWKPGASGKRYAYFIDGRVCNALVRMGVLQHTGEGTGYKLVRPPDA